MTFEELQQVIPQDERMGIGLQLIAEMFPNIPKELKKDGQ